jgi:alpha(1,3/1,4) fucosyltransferase
MIKVFKLGRLRRTPFSCEEDLAFLKAQGIVMVDNILDCDVIMTARLPRLKPLRLIFGASKKYLTWTNEPRYDTTFEPVNRSFLWAPDIHVMNVYTGDIFVNNYTLPLSEPCYRNYWDKPLKFLDEMNFPDFQHKKVVAVMGYKGNQREVSLKRYGQEIDLAYLRTQIALTGYRLGSVDIYGQEWPDHISLEDSREGDYQERKALILKDYHFNLCFENTNFDYYCTEKIWDSIEHGCLPIYYGAGNKIYEDFPSDSFIDYPEFSSPAELFESIERMTVDEFRTRMNRCIEVFNTIHERLKTYNRYEQFLLRIANKIKEVTVT